METKTCTACHTEKPFSEFYKAKRGKYGLAATCKTCSDKQTKEWQKNNRERSRENGRQWELNNPEKIKAKTKKYRENNREKINIAAQNRAKADPEHVKEIRRKHAEKYPNYNKDWYQKNIEKERIRSRKKYLKYKEKKQEYQRQYFAKRPGLKQEQKRNRRAREKKAQGIITKGEWANLLDKYRHQCLCCGRKDIKITMDHVIPLVSGGNHSIDNIQPLCVSCNSKKHTQTIDYRK